MSAVHVLVFILYLSIFACRRFFYIILQHNVFFDRRPLVEFLKTWKMEGKFGRKLLDKTGFVRKGQKKSKPSGFSAPAFNKKRNAFEALLGNLAQILRFFAT